MKPNFKDININVIPQTEDPKEWENKNGIKPEWETVEHINVRPAYTSAQLEGMEHLNYAAGIAPYLRGCVLGQSVNMLVSQQLKNQMLSIVVTSLLDKKVCQLLSTLLHTVAMTPTTNALWVTSVKLV